MRHLLQPVVFLENKLVEIKSIEIASPAEKAGIKAGDKLVAVNEKIVEDSLDYGFYTATNKLTIELEDRTITLTKQEFEPLGLVFEGDLYNGKRSCKNRCVFCFIDQLPKGLRESLYLKDDDERLSFLMGNYITLTNLNERLIDRILKMKFSPLNISVHTMDPQLRSQIMCNPMAGEALSLIPRFAKAGISMNIQLVLCPGLNDGKQLEYSLSELQKLYPAVQSVSAVPVGLTRFRDNLYPLKAFDEKTAAQNLLIIENFGRECLKKFETRLFYASDEIYLLAKKKIPPRRHYEEFLQLENGVGMWREFYERNKGRFHKMGGGFDLATGVLATPLMEQMCESLTDTTVHTVTNNFFGEGVTVAGLITGCDLVEQLKGKLTTSKLLIPAQMFRSEGDLTLDGMTVQEISDKLNVEIVVFE